MKKLAVALSFVAISFILGNTAHAEKKFNFGIHLSSGINFAPLASFNVGLKLNALKYCPLGLEAMLLVPHGFEVSLPIYLINLENFQFHAILPFMGVEVPFMRTPISVPWLKKGREWNLAVGGGVEIVVDSKKIIRRKTLIRHIGFNLDFRIFFPNPIFVLDTFADYGAVVLRQAAKEGFIWAGVTFWY